MFNNYDIIAKLDNIRANDHDINHINNFSNYINDVELENVNELAKSLLDTENLFFCGSWKIPSRYEQHSEIHFRCMVYKS